MIKKVILLSLSYGLLFSTAFAKTFYVAPDGSNSNPGNKASPFATVQRAQEAVEAGDTVYIRGGKYRVREDQFAKKQGVFDYFTYIDKSGKPGQRINYWAYPGETPVFDLSDIKPEGLRVDVFHVTASWVHFKGIEVTGVQVTIKGHTESYCFYSWGANNIFELLKLHDNQGTGLRHRGSGANNLFLNCDSYQNHDYTSENGKGGNTDGFGCHPTKGGTGNIFRGCRSWFNSDDGFDVLGAEESVTFDHCWAFYNGYSTTFESLADGNGFKGGGYGGRKAEDLPNPVPRHTIRFCLAVRNKNNGFYANHHIQGDDWFNNSAYRNGVNFNMLNRLADNTTDVPGYTHKMRNNLGYKGNTETKNIDPAKNDISHDYFDMNLTASEDDFVSLDEKLLIAMRQADGGLPDTGFMRLKANSKFVGQGLDIGFPYKDKAPNLGAF